MAEDLEGEFKVEVSAELGPFEVVNEEKWHDLDVLRTAQVISGINEREIDEAVEKAFEIYKELDWGKLALVSRMSLGDALVLGGHCEEGYEVLMNALAEAEKRSAGYAQWIEWQACWAAWMSGDQKKAEEAFSRMMNDGSGKPIDRGSWTYHQWIVAYLLDKATQAEFVKFCSTESTRMDDPHFFYAEKLFQAGEYEKAGRAYAVCAKMSEEAGDLYFGNWARWRLKQAEKLSKGK